MEPNPAWADRVLAEHWDAIAARVGPARMPLPAPRTGRRSSWAEYGCGHYGCVYPTHTRERVFKITFDASEAALISCLKRLGDDAPGGIVSYDGVWQVPEASHKARRVFVIVREEVHDVGKMGFTDSGLRYGSDRHRSESQALRRLINFKNWASIARDRIRKAPDARAMVAAAAENAEWAEGFADYDTVLRSGFAMPSVPRWIQGPRAVAYALRACAIVAETMGGEDVGYLIGESLGGLLEAGILLADVHGQNVGQVNRGPHGDGMWVISDPGHMVPLRDEWFDVTVPFV